MIISTLLEKVSVNVCQTNYAKQTTTSEDIKQHGINKLNFAYPVCIM